MIMLAVQSKVNEMLSSKKSIDAIAKEVIRGDWGNGQDRKNNSQKPVMTIFRYKKGSMNS